MDDQEELTQQWLHSERAAVQAEMAVASIQREAASPEAEELYRTALEKRRAADTLFHQLYILIKKPPPG